MPNWREQKEAEDKAYYAQAEEDLKHMSKYDYPGHNDPYYQPGGDDKKGCRSPLFMMLSAIALIVVGVLNIIF